MVKCNIISKWIYIILILLVFVSCSDKIQYHSVYFISEDVQYTSISVQHGNTVLPPVSPVRDGYVFTGWFSDSSCISEYDFSCPIQSDIYLYAGWTKQIVSDYFVVSFVTNGGSAIASQTVIPGNRAELPEPPIKEGYSFSGWYTDPQLINVYNFDTPVHADIVLYASWSQEVQKTYTVTFISNGGSPVLTQFIQSGVAVKKPEDPTRSNYNFGGWYCDAELKNQYNFNRPIQSDLILYAKWNPDGVYVVSFTIDRRDISDTNIESQVILEGEYAINPENSLSGNWHDNSYIFSGWYYEDRITKFDFNTPITENLDLYANWEKIVDFTPTGATDAKYFLFSENPDGTLSIKNIINSDEIYDLIVPETVNGKSVYSFEPQSFSGSIKSCFINVSKVGDYAFRGGFSSSSIETIIFGPKVKEIGMCAFMDCDKLTSVRLPENGAILGESLFTRCSNLRVLSIPAGTKNIRDSFGMAGQMNFTKIIFEDGWTEIPYGACTYIGSTLQTVELPEGLKIIGDRAFEGCKVLKSINLPASLEVIGVQAFSWCSALTEIKLPKNLKTISNEAFSHTGLEYVSIPDSITELPSNLFSGSNLATIEIPDTVVRLSRSALAGCNNLEYIKLPAKLETISDEVFYECRKLKDVVMPEYVENIEDSIFLNCPELKEVEVPNANYISQLAFSGSCIESLIFREGTEYVGSYVCSYSNMPYLKRITVPSDCMWTRDSFNQSHLEQIKFKEGWEEIKGELFNGLEYLTEIDFPSSLKKLSGWNLFSDNKELKSIILPAGVVWEYELSPFKYSYIENVILQEGWTEIPQNAFLDFSTMKSIELPNGISSIGKEAFKNCSNLSEITIPSTVETVESSIFKGCNNLNAIRLEVEEIPSKWHHDWMNGCNATVYNIDGAVIE